MLGSHGLGGVQSGSIERYLLDPGNMTRHISLSQSFCLVLVPPVLEELLKQGCLTTLREDLDLKQMSQPIRSQCYSVFKPLCNYTWKVQTITTSNMGLNTLQDAESELRVSLSSKKAERVLRLYNELP